MEDREFILESARRLERWENTPRAVPDGYADMSRDELIKLVAYLTERLEESDVARRKEREEERTRGECGQYIRPYSPSVRTHGRAP